MWGLVRTCHIPSLAFSRAMTQYAPREGTRAHAETLSASIQLGKVPLGDTRFGAVRAQRYPDRAHGCNRRAARNDSAVEWRGRCRLRYLPALRTVPRPGADRTDTRQSTEGLDLAATTSGRSGVSVPLLVKDL